MSITEAAQEIKTVEPQTLAAPAEDVELASKATPVDVPLPAAAPEQDVAAFSQSIENSLKIPGLEIGATEKTNFDVDPPVELVSPVKQWSPDWVQYDEYYRPIILNPYRDPVRIVYMYEMTPRIMVVPPLGRMVFEAAQYAAYNFTAALLAPVAAAVGTVQALTDIAVGSFFGGGYYPGVGMAPPPPPPPVMRYDNVPVLVNYSNARYEPFRVNRIVDVGDDAQFGERKVLLDGVTPAWGVWSEAGGERIFEVHRTQQFPGLEAPQEGPLPGDYQLKLASDAAPAGRDVRQGHLPDGVGRRDRHAGLRRHRVGMVPRPSQETGALSSQRKGRRVSRRPFRCRRDRPHRGSRRRRHWRGTQSPWRRRPSP